MKKILIPILLLFSISAMGQTGGTPIYTLDANGDINYLIISRKDTLGDTVFTHIKTSQLRDTFPELFIDTIWIQNTDATLGESRDIDLNTFDFTFSDGTDIIRISPGLIDVAKGGGSGFEVQGTATETFIGTNTNHPLVIQTNSLEVARMLTTGQLNLNNYNGATFTTGTDTVGVLVHTSTGDVFSLDLSQIYVNYEPAVGGGADNSATVFLTDGTITSGEVEFEGGSGIIVTENTTTDVITHTLDATGDWTGTLDTYEAAALLDNTNVDVINTIAGNRIATVTGLNGPDDIDETITTITSLPGSGNNIGQYNAEDGTPYIIRETVTSLSLTNDSLFYDKETDGVLDTISLLSYLDNTDSQGLDVAQLTGTNLELSLDNDGEATNSIDLSSLQDGTGTDDQTLSEVLTQGNDAGDLTASNFNSIDINYNAGIDQLTLDRADGSGTFGVFHDASNWVWFSNSSGNRGFRFETNPTGGGGITERFRLDADGEIKIWEVTGVTQTINISGESSEHTYFNAGNNFGIGVTVPLAGLHTTGTHRHTGLATTGTLDRILAIEADGDVFEEQLSNIDNSSFINGAGYITSADDADADPTNEIQYIDTLELVGTTLRASLINDAVATKEVDLSSLQDGTGTDDQNLTEVLTEGNTAVNDILLNAATTETRFLRLGAGRSGNGFTHIDLVGDATHTSYGTRLIRNSGGANTESILTHKGTGQLMLRTESLAPITFRTNSTERVRIDTIGRVGIGTTSPLDNLHIANGDIRISNTNTYVEFDHFDFSTNGSQLNISPVTGDAIQGGVVGLFRSTNTAGLSDFRIYKADGTATINHSLRANSTSYLCADNGDLAIGHTSPLAQLHLDGTLRLQNLPTTGTLAGILAYEADGDIFQETLGDISLSSFNNDITITESQISDLSHTVDTDDQTLTEVLTEGNDAGGLDGLNFGGIGINTSSLSAALHVQGTSEVEFLIQASAGNPDMSFAEVGNVKSQIKYVTASNGLGFYVDDTHTGLGGISGTSNFFIESGGDVGIATDNPSYKLDVNGTANMTGFRMPTGANDTYVLTSDGSGVGTWQAVSGDGNIYDNDGTLTANRTLTHNGFNLIYSWGANDNLTFYGDESTGIIHTGDNKGAYFTPYEIGGYSIYTTGLVDLKLGTDGEHDDLIIDGTTHEITIDTIAPYASGDSVIVWQPNGKLGRRSAAGMPGATDKNMAEDNLTLDAERTHTLNQFDLNFAGDQATVTIAENGKIELSRATMKAEMYALSDAVSVFGTSTDHTMRFVQNNDPRFQFTTNGRIGVFELIPDTDFHVTGGVKLEGAVEVTSTLDVTGDSNLSTANISNMMVLTPTATVPSTPATGTVYMDDGTNTGGTPTLRYYNGTSWVNM